MNFCIYLSDRREEHDSIAHGGYCRVSTQKQTQLDSLVHQRLFFASYARSNQLHLTHIYADAGISGRQMRNRTEFLHMLDDAQAGAFDVLCVKDISRFARNTVDCLQAVRQLKQCGVQLRFLSEGQACMGDSGIYSDRIRVTGAGGDAAHLSKRTNLARTSMPDAGRVPPVIFGYTRTGLFSLRIQPREAETVREMFRLYLAGMGAAGHRGTLKSCGTFHKARKQMGCTRRAALSGQFDLLRRVRQS